MTDGFVRSLCYAVCMDIFFLILVCGLVAWVVMEVMNDRHDH